MGTTEIVKKETMSKILAKDSVGVLGQNLNLSQEQIAKARSNALRLSSDSKLSKCDPMSLVKFCFETARYNFTRDDCIYPVPYGDKVQTQMGYKGLRELAMRSGKYNEINCSAVLSCDKVKRDRLTGRVFVEFEEDITKAKGDVIGYYAFAINKQDQVTNTLFMSKEDVEKHGKHYSKTYGSIWGDSFGFEKMAKKTVIKQLCSQLDQTPELKEALAQDQIVHGKENEEDAYLDNPNNEKETKKTNVRNSIIPEDVIDLEIEETTGEVGSEEALLNELKTMEEGK